MFVVIGADWCPGCKAVRAALTKRDLEHTYVKMPPGKEGWDMVEKLTGRRAVPAVMFKFDGPKATIEALKQVGLDERDLTEEEYDEIFD